MTNSVICVLSLSLIIYTALRLRDINRNLKKYDLIQGFDKYVKSKWYWDPEEDFSRGDPPHKCVVIAEICFLITMALLMVPVIILEYLHPDPECMFTFSYPAELILMIVPAIMAGLMCYFVPLHLKSPIAIGCNIHNFLKGKPRSFAWKRITICTLIGTILCFPLYLLALNNYLMADEEKLTYSDFFSLEEHVIRYDEVNDIETSYNEDGELESYIFVSDCGKAYPISAEDYSKSELDYIISKIEKQPQKSR